MFNVSSIFPKKLSQDELAQSCISRVFSDLNVEALVVKKEDNFRVDFSRGLVEWFTQDELYAVTVGQLEENSDYQRFCKELKELGSRISGVKLEPAWTIEMHHAPSGNFNLEHNSSGQIFEASYEAS